jgi:hypothetical protein
MKSVRIPNITRTHTPKTIADGSIVLGILRNPVDSLASRLSYNYFIKKISDMSPKEYASESINDLMDLYKDVYSYYLNNKCFLVLNENLRDFPKKTINELFEIFNVKNVFYGAENKDLNNIDEAIEGSYVVSSKSLGYYQEMMEFVLELDLSELNYLYNKAKESAIIFI